MRETVASPLTGTAGLGMRGHHRRAHATHEHVCGRHWNGTVGTTPHLGRDAGRRNGGTNQLRPHDPVPEPRAHRRRCLRQGARGGSPLSPPAAGLPLPDQGTVPLERFPARPLPLLLNPPLCVRLAHCPSPVIRSAEHSPHIRSCVVRPSYTTCKSPRVANRPHRSQTAGSVSRDGTNGPRKLEHRPRHPP